MEDALVSGSRGLVVEDGEGGLAARLFAAGRDRLGWAWVDEGAPRPGPPPQPSAPEPPDDTWVAAARERARAGLQPFHEVLTVVFAGLGLWAAALVIGAMSGPEAQRVAALVPVLLPAGLAVAVLWLAAQPQAAVGRRHRRELAAHEARMTAHRAEVERAREDWHAEVQRWDRAQPGQRWVPVTGAADAAPVDVFGGTAAGWSAFLATFGSSVLARGASVLVLDLSQDEVTGDLLAVAAEAGRPGQVVRLPEQLDRVDLLAGLDREGVVEVLTGAVDARREAGATGDDDRDLDADLLTTVVGCLDDPLSVARVAAGVRVLSGRAGDARLAGAEVERLVDAMGHAAGYDRARERLGLLRVALDLLGEADPADPADARPPSSPGGVAVVETGGNERRKQLLDRVLVQVLEQGLRRAGRGPRAGARDPGSAAGAAGAGHDAVDASGDRRQTVVIAGADHAGLEALERVARQARRNGVQLVRMFHHLRDGSERLLGAGDAQNVLMRLPNAQEAALAAEFLGRGHRFHLTSRTREAGTSRTGTDGWSRTDDQSVTAGKTYPSGWFPHWGDWTASDTRATSTAVGTSRSTATTASSSESTGEQRVYEYEVEPTTLQHLPPTALATTSPGSPTPTFADCDPAIASLPGVAATPAATSTAHAAVPSRGGTRVLPTAGAPGTRAPARPADRR